MIFSTQKPIKYKKTVVIIIDKEYNHHETGLILISEKSRIVSTGNNIGNVGKSAITELISVR